MSNRYRVHGCKYEVGRFEHGKLYIHISRADNSQAEIWGVYEVQEDGTEKWLADFRERGDAEMFALEKEEIK